MELKGIKMICPILDGSGYAEASRKNAIALHKSGVPITIEPTSFEQVRPNLGRDGNIIHSLINKDIEYNVIMMETTPEFWEKYKEPGKIFAGFTIWETSKLHPTWPNYINNTADLCMVGCDWNVEIFKNSGVTVPIVSVPHVMDVNEFKNIQPYDINGLDKDSYIFYFIGQWTERKNVLSAIKTYWRTFRNGENVALVMKVYRNDYSESEREAIRTTIRRLKTVCTMEGYTYPPVYLVLDMLSDEEIKGLHAKGDCYVSLDRGEGFGLSTATAGAAGNPVIATGFGGATEYLKRDNSYLVDYVETCCHGMPWSRWYSLDQYWASPNEKHASQLMKYVYENRDEAKERGKKLQNYIDGNLNWKVIGQKIIDSIRSL
jgi:glycosyltransferase involved in cell wall biosynthesis